MGQLVRNTTQGSSIEAMDKLLKYSEILAESTIIPAHYKGNKGDIFVAVQTAYRMNLDPMMVMQGTYVIQGKLGMTSAFAISLANSSGLFVGGIRYRIQELGEDIEGSVEFYNNGTKDKKKVKFSNIQVTAYTNLKSNGEEISYTIGIKEAIAEGWTTKAGNKYQSLPELMLRYRAATLLIRTHTPEVINGMHMTEELEDVQSAKTMRTVESAVAQTNKAASLLDSFLEVEEIITDTIEEGKVLEALPIIRKDNCFELHGLIARHNISQELVSKWCDAGGVTTLEELDNNKVQSCIDYIIKRNQDEKYVGQDIERLPS
jgi:hypothetical protein